MQVQDTLAEIEERGEAVRELEKSLLDLRQKLLKQPCTPSSSYLQYPQRVV